MSLIVISLRESLKAHLVLLTVSKIRVSDLVGVGGFIVAIHFRLASYQFGHHIMNDDVLLLATTQRYMNSILLHFRTQKYT